MPSSIKKILAATNHRPWPMPARPFQWYQEWNRVLFFHWKVPAIVIHRLLPDSLSVDLFDDSAWISLVPFTMEKIRPSFLPSMPLISNFHEVNLRTYVTDGEKPGVYFLDIQAQKALSVYLANMLSVLCYSHSKIIRVESQEISEYHLKNTKKNLHLNVEYEVGSRLAEKSELDKWLTERYRLYVEKKENVCLYDVHHLEWPLAKLHLQKFSHTYRIPGFEFSIQEPQLCHYSEGVKVLAWGSAR